MWERYFKLCNIKPGKVVIHKFGLINFADPNIPPEKVLKIYKSGCRFLELTPEGEEYLYGRKTTSNTKTTNVNSSWAGDKGEAAFKNPDKNKTVSQSPAFDEENKEEKTYLSVSCYFNTATLDITSDTSPKHL